MKIIQNDYYSDDYDKPDFVKSSCLITSVRILEGSWHDELTIFSRGGNAGSIIVNKGDGLRIAQRLLDG